MAKAIRDLQGAIKANNYTGMRDYTGMSDAPTTFHKQGHPDSAPATLAKAIRDLQGAIKANNYTGMSDALTTFHKLRGETRVPEAQWMCEVTCAGSIVSLGYGGCLLDLITYPTGECLPALLVALMPCYQCPWTACYALPIGWLCEAGVPLGSKFCSECR